MCIHFQDDIIMMALSACNNAGGTVLISRTE